MRSSVRLVRFTLLALVLAATTAAFAAPRWALLGTRTVTDRLDHDTIVVTAKEGRFDALQIRVRKIAVQFRSVTVHFGDDSSQEIELRAVIPAGGQSRVIDLAGGERVIRSVEFAYDSQSLRGRRAIVRLYGRH